jgi:hypothetical protein
MKLKEYAEKSGITLKEAKEQTGLTHWNQTVPEIMEADVEILPEVIETESKELTWDDCPVSYRKLFHSIMRRRKRSPYYEFKHLLKG